jgi:regulator of replication initiation timing
MENDQLHSAILSLESKVTHLVSKHHDLLNELEHLRLENMGLKDSLRKKEEQLKDFQNQFKITKLVNTISVNKDEVPELKQKISEYIKEIDKCILHLSK